SDMRLLLALAVLQSLETLLDTLCRSCIRRRPDGNGGHACVSAAVLCELPPNERLISHSTRFRLRYPSEGCLCIGLPWRMFRGPAPAPDDLETPPIVLDELAGANQQST